MPVRGRNGGNAGQGSKWISKRTRFRVYTRDHWGCVWCQTPIHAIDGKCGYTRGPDRVLLSGSRLGTLDHVIPRSAGGTNKPHNLITCCMVCNRERGDLDVFNFASNHSDNAKRRYIATCQRVLAAVCSPLPAVA